MFVPYRARQHEKWRANVDNVAISGVYCRKIAVEEARALQRASARISISHPTSSARVPRHRILWPLRRLPSGWRYLANVLFVLTQGCGLQSRPAASNACTEHVVHSRVARVGENPIYIEPESFNTNARDASLLAGTPVYVWDSTGKSESAPVNGALGVVIAPDGVLRLLTVPLEGKTIGAVRTAALSDGWWAIVFADIVPRQRAQDDAVVKALWYGESDGTHWRHLERLPSVGDTLTLDRLSALVVENDRALIAVPGNLAHQESIVTYSRDQTGWHVRTQPSFPIAYLTLGNTRTRDVLFVVGSDPRLIRDHNSLFELTKSPGEGSWNTAVRLVEGPSHPVHHPLVTSQDTGLIVSWLQQDPESGSRSVWYLHLRDDGSASGAPQHVDDDILSQASTQLDDGAAWALTARDSASATDYSLHLETRTRAGATHRHIKSPFTTVLGIAPRHDSVMVVGPRPARSDADPPVVSLLLTVSRSCLRAPNKTVGQRTSRSVGNRG